jgi:hypothetical protein
MAVEPSRRGPRWLGPTVVEVPLPSWPATNRRGPRRLGCKRRGSRWPPWRTTVVGQIS